jgi:DNA-binding GntR family transcriptional regulator
MPARTARAVPTRGAGVIDGTPSLVDGAEVALHNWLAAGHYRQGDRLPPEHEVAAMLGVSRGTLRSALKRLEGRGEIVRRQGSGTFAGRVAMPAALDERLDRLEPYSSLAARRGLKLTCEQLRIGRGAVGMEIGEALGLAPIATATTISRTLVANDEPVALMFDVIHPDVGLPSDEELRTLLERGLMVLDVLIGAGVAVTFARTRVSPQLLTGRDRDGKRLGLTRATAVLQLEETIYAGSEARVAFSRDVFAPGGHEVTVMRSLESPRPAPVNGGRNGVPRSGGALGAPAAGRRVRRSANGKI